MFVWHFIVYAATVNSDAKTTNASNNYSNLRQAKMNINQRFVPSKLTPLAIAVALSS
ncbi:MAG: hypothetical protein ACI9NT_001723, partial [Bacteroidia bacterium]